MKAAWKAAFALLLSTAWTWASAQETQALEYRRSSLNMLMLNDEVKSGQEKLNNWWTSYPFPDKYNDHRGEKSVVDISNVVLSHEELTAYGAWGDTLTGIKWAAMKALGADPESGVSVVDLGKNADGKEHGLVVPSAAAQRPYKILKALEEAGVARNMVAKWFGYNAEANSFSLDLIGERGLYDASLFDVQAAAQTVKNERLLKDAGKQLIANSFVTLSDIDFFANEPLAKAVYDAAMEEANGNPAGELAAKKIYQKTKDGYSVVAETFLYQLDWDDAALQRLYSGWANPSEALAQGEFSLSLVNSQKTVSTVLLAKGRTMDEVLQEALYRNIDNSFSKLQKQNEVFMPAVPVIGVNPITAPIGMKEGLEGGEKFRVFEMTYDPESGETKFVEAGTVKVDKKQIWNNLFSLSQAEAEGPPQYTAFKGGKGVFPGMMIKQIK